ncbi:conserved hypothetical protein [Streptomyces viridochromogenes DSM 40736]|uniref:DUF2510 domain-containing protein n=1 Tax=Streptomyces viridochromogenes (strain DSM 40736 / JCM 4977 / BCRC 1201 / Tue 494) TaxID=591159 RepID=D9XCJ6_STRVT|nr:conserved hypothetical protein [Streptomyces viridochromogenes DSM 40736]
MSAPTPAPGDDRPREGYYPDPSIPGYVRYWNGASWVPGTSRPAPQDGETLAPPPGAGQSGAASVEETGPHFFDEDPVEEPSAADSQHGSRPEPASAWGADRSHQSGFGGQDRRVSWGSPPVAQGTGGQGADPRVPHADSPPSGESARTDGTANIPPAAADQESGAAAAGNTFVFRRPTGEPGSGPGASAEAPEEGTMTFRAVSPRPGSGGAGSGGGPAGSGFGARTGGSAGDPAAPGFGPRAGAAGSGADSAAAAFGAQPGPAGSGAGPRGLRLRRGGPGRPLEPSRLRCRQGRRRPCRRRAERRRGRGSPGLHRPGGPVGSPVGPRPRRTCAVRPRRLRRHPPQRRPRRRSVLLGAAGAPARRSGRR